MKHIEEGGTTEGSNRGMVNIFINTMSQEHPIFMSVWNKIIRSAIT